MSSTPDRAVRVRALAGDIVLCSWARTVPLSTQVYKWVPANLMLGVTLRWTSILSRGSRYIIFHVVIVKIVVGRGSSANFVLFAVDENIFLNTFFVTL